MDVVASHTACFYSVLERWMYCLFLNQSIEGFVNRCAQDLLLPSLLTFGSYVCPESHVTNLCWDQQQGWSIQGSGWSAENMKAMLCICPNLVLILWKLSLQVLVPTKSRYSKFGTCPWYFGIWFMELIAQRKIDYKVWWQFVSRYISIYFSQSIFITVLYHALPTYSSEI
jgi:hypothetical protein